MPELAELKFTADYVNQISKGQTYVNVEKNPVHKCEDLNIPFKKFNPQQNQNYCSVGCCCLAGYYC